MKVERKEVVVSMIGINPHEPVKRCRVCYYYDGNAVYHKAAVIIKYETGAKVHYCLKHFRRWRAYGSGSLYNIEYINQEVIDKLK